MDSLTQNMYYLYLYSVITIVQLTEVELES